MTTYMPPACYWCVHKREGLKCDAFPEGIPLDIIDSTVIHTVPYPGDNGILYEQGPEAPPVWVQERLQGPVRLDDEEPRP